MCPTPPMAALARTNAATASGSSMARTWMFPACALPFAVRFLRPPGTRILGPEAFASPLARTTFR